MKNNKGSTTGLSLEMSVIARVRARFLNMLYISTHLRSAVAPKDLIIFYITCIRSLLEYACPVFHRALPGYLSDDLERLQRRALRIIFPSLSYSGAIVESGLTTLYQRREEISQRTFNELANDNEHKLYHLLPIRSNSNYAARHQRKFNLPRVKTERCKNSFIISHIYK